MTTIQRAAFYAALLFFTALAVSVPCAVFATAAQTATAGVIATRTAVALTPHPQYGDAAVRELNAHSGPSGVKLGDLLQALWDGRQSGGDLSVATPGPVVDVAAITAMVRGVYLAKAAATAEALTACGNTTASQFRKCTLCVNSAGTFRFEPGAVTTVSQAAAKKPYCKDVETEVAYIELPNSFTSGSTTVSAGMLKQSATRASTVRGF